MEHIRTRLLPIDLYHTTRGLGLAQMATMNLTQKVLPKIEIPVHSLFRVSLLQFEYKIERYMTARVPNHYKVQGSENYPCLDDNDSQTIRRFPKNFATIADIINACGDVKIGNTIFRPSRMKLNDDPKFLRITTLREYVTQAADPNTPLALRSRMFALNSIPGAEWTNTPDGGPLLLNPDDIIPPNYGHAEKSGDFATVECCFEIIAKKMPKYIGQINFDSKEGSAGQLVSTVIRHNDVNTFVSCQQVPEAKIIGDIDYFYASENISGADMMRGILCLFGEIEIDNSGGNYVIQPWAYSRAEELAKCDCSCSYETCLFASTHVP